MIEDNLNTENGNVEGYDNPENYGIGAGDIISSMDGDVDNYGGTSGGDCFGHNSYLDDGYGSLEVNGHQNHALTNNEVRSMSDGLKNHMNNLQIAFEGNEYTDAEIDKMESDVNMAQSEVNARRADESNWETKVSLNNTKEHRENGDYANALSRLNEAKSRYNTAVDRLNDAQSKLRNAK